MLTHHGTAVLQAQSSSLQQQVQQLEAHVKQLQELSDANGKVVQDKMANLVGECPCLCSRTGPLRLHAMRV